MEESIGFELIAKSITVIVSVFIAATLAMSNLKKKQKIDDENEKFKNIITLLVCASRCHSNLSNAWNTLSNIKEEHGPFRGLNVTTGGVVEKVDEGPVFNLYWLPSEVDASTTDGLGFRNLAYIQHMFEKYNQWVKLYGELGELKKVINIELSEASNVKGLDLKKAIRKTRNYNCYVDYISKFELNVLLLSQLIAMFETFTQEFPIIAGEVLDLKLIGKKSVPMFALAEGSMQDNLFDVDVFSDEDRMKLMKELVDELEKIRSKTASTLEIDGI